MATPLQFRTKLAGRRGFVIVGPTGERFYRLEIEHADDAFALVECGDGHVYAVDRSQLRRGNVSECPRCAAGDRRAA